VYLLCGGFSREILSFRAAVAPVEFGFPVYAGAEGLRGFLRQDA